MRRYTHPDYGPICPARCFSGRVCSFAGDNDSILAKLHKVSTVATTVPANGDVNPYGVAKAKNTVGNLTENHILVSNFNDSRNAQGTGTTIVDVAPDGAVPLFA